MGETATFSRGDHVQVEGWSGVAFWFIGHPVIDEDSGEVDTERALVRMVGDDRDHDVDIDDVTPLEREAFCGECGQMGCTHDGLERA
jgi:hypothetical protein